MVGVWGCCWVGGVVQPAAPSTTTQAAPSVHLEMAERGLVVVLIIM
jgi:hypothetical protein